MFFSFFNKMFLLYNNNNNNNNIFNYKIFYSRVGSDEISPRSIQNTYKTYISR